MGRSLELPAEPPALKEVRRIVQIFRELRSGRTLDGKTKIKSPSSSLSSAEAISVINNGMALAGHFGDGVLHPRDVAAGLIGAVIKDPVQDTVVWKEYLEIVVKEREDWKPLYRRVLRIWSERSDDDPVHYFGIRHHGPGCARSLLRAFEALQPDCVLVEGPPDAQAVLAALLSEHMQPPVALLSYCPDEPQRAVYHPFAVFSPEWQALRWALLKQVPVRFIDLPVMHQMALDKAREAAEAAEAEEAAQQEAEAENRGRSAARSRVEATSGDAVPPQADTHAPRTRPPTAPTR